MIMCTCPEYCIRYT